MPNIHEIDPREHPPYKKGDVILGNSRDNVYQTDIFVVEKLEWQEQRAYWRVTTEEGSSFTAESCRIATLNDLDKEIAYQRELLENANDRVVKLTYFRALKENT